MRIRISYIDVVDDEFRRAVNIYYGRPGLASREDIVTLRFTSGISLDADIASEAADQLALEAEEREKIRISHGKWKGRK